MVKDVVCGMEVNEGKASFESEYEGRTYRFCSAVCKTKFERNPAHYVK